MNLRALVVDDNEINRDLFTIVLESQGFTVETACNGKEAVEAAELIEFGVILMDVGMPVMDGITATQLIRERELLLGRQHAKIIVVTAYSSPVIARNSLLSGADGHLTKPLNTAALLDLLWSAA